MIQSNLAHVDTWVFDLDNTLYPPHMCLFDQIEVKMTDYIMRNLSVDHATATELRGTYWRTHGTTLSGLMDAHDIDPMAFLFDVHDVDFSVLAPDPTLARQITDLPGRRIVFTNGDIAYAGNVLKARGLDGVFDAIYGIETAEFQAKPHRAAFEKVFGLDGFDVTRAAMFEDDSRNLAVPHAMGLRTIHVAPTPKPAPFIDHHTDDLSHFLTHLV